MSGITGLNYPSVQFLLNMYAYDDPVSVFEDLQILELAAMSVFNKDAEKK
jgi:hypothetical protein